MNTTKQLKNFYINFVDSYIQTWDDTKSNNKQFTSCFPASEIPQKLKWLFENNKKGMGISFSPNPCVGGRKQENVTAIKWVYVDMDEGTKQEMLKTIEGAPIAPHLITETNRGFHMFWRVDCDDAQFKKIIHGLIDHFDGDKAVSSKNEVLRLPGFCHVKDPANPFKIKIIKNDMPGQFSVEQMVEAYPYSPPAEKFQKRHGLRDDELDIVKDLPIREVLRGLGVELSNDNFIMENGEKTSASINVKENYIHRFSGKEGSGSTIDAVVTYGGKTLEEAILYLKEIAGVQMTPQRAAQKVIDNTSMPEIDPIDESQIVMTWGTDLLNHCITPIDKRHFIVLAGETGSGKTTFCFDVAYKNAMNGVKVLFLSLEMSRDGILTRAGRAYAGITKAEWRDKSSISEDKKKKYTKRKKDLCDIDNLLLKGFPKNVKPTMENIFEIIRKTNPSLVFIDNFDLIEKADKKTEYDEQNRIATELMNFSNQEQYPLVVLHHFKKGTDKAEKRGLDSIRGSGKITHNCDTALICYRKYDKEATPEDNSKLTIIQSKDRDFGQLAAVEVYFKDGTFRDQYHPEKWLNQGYWQDK